MCCTSLPPGHFLSKSHSLGIDTGKLDIPPPFSPVLPFYVLVTVASDRGFLPALIYLFLSFLYLCSPPPLAKALFFRYHPSRSQPLSFFIPFLIILKKGLILVGSFSRFLFCLETFQIFLFGKTKKKEGETGH